MRWTERQRAMLREMGVQLWARDAPEDGVAAPAAPPAHTDTEGGAAVVTQEVAPAAPTAATATRPIAGAPADWLVVGEPVDSTDSQQEELLDNMLRAINVARIAPTRDGRAVYRAVAAAPSGSAATLPDPALQAAFDAVAPRCVLALGRAAAAALLGDDAPLGTLRGRVHDRDGVAVVVTFSLAFLLRHPAEKAKAWADLCLAVGALAVSP